MDGYISEEEAELRLEHEINRLENQPDYMTATLDEFCANPTDIGAKRLWLKYALSNETPPELVTKRMINIMIKQVEKYDIDKDTVKAHNEQWDEDRFYELLHIAHTDQNKFWELILNSSGERTLYDDLLDRLRRWLPTRQHFKTLEINMIFNALEKGEENLIKVASTDVENLRQRYIKRKNKEKKIMKLFDIT